MTQLVHSNRRGRAISTGTYGYLALGGRQSLLPAKLAPSDRAYGDDRSSTLSTFRTVGALTARQKTYTIESMTFSPIKSYSYVIVGKGLWADNKEWYLLNLRSQSGQTVPLFLETGSARITKRTRIHHQQNTRKLSHRVLEATYACKTECHFYLASTT